MPSITKLIPVFASVLFMATQVSAGCYGGDLWFNGLHGGKMDKRDLTSEVKSDIEARCREVNGKTIAKDTPFWKCTSWPKLYSNNEDCFDDCLDKCEPKSDDSGIASAFCAAEQCRKTCDAGVPVNEFNRIDWAIEKRDGGSKSIDYETCVNAFNTELGGCNQGSESNHDGFWFRIDPNHGNCK